MNNITNAVHELLTTEFDIPETKIYYEVNPQSGSIVIRIDTNEPREPITLNFTGQP